MDKPCLFGQKICTFRVKLETDQELKYQEIDNNTKQLSFLSGHVCFGKNHAI